MESSARQALLIASNGSLGHVSHLDVKDVIQHDV